MRFSSHGTSAPGFTSERATWVVPGPTHTGGPPDPRRATVWRGACFVESLPKAPRIRASSARTDTRSSAGYASSRSSSPAELAAIATEGTSSPFDSTARTTLRTRATSPAYHYSPFMSVHSEEARFVISIDLSAEFGEEYEGDDD